MSRLFGATVVSLFVGALALNAADVKAATVGVAVDALGSMDPAVGSTEFRSDLGGEAIRYFIPLTSSPPTCTYGAGCGTSSDSGTGGTVMSMFLRFTPVSTTGPSVLEINFEDLDLAGANDPTGFFEQVEVFNSGGISLTGGPIMNIANALVTGDADTQQLLSLALGVISNPFFVELQFSASSSGGTNTPEFLIATVHPVPVPAALPLFGTGLGVMGLAGWFRRRRIAAAV